LPSSSDPNERCILDGQGISCIFYGINTTITFERIVFLNGTANDNDLHGYGGALFLENSTTSIIQSSFLYNKAIFGGAISIQKSIFTIDVGDPSNNSSTNANCSSVSLVTVFTSNVASGSGGAIDIGNNTEATMTNAVFRNNRAASLVGFFLSCSFLCPTWFYLLAVFDIQLTASINFGPPTICTICASYTNW
jgi:hypothetical protein